MCFDILKKKNIKELLEPKWPAELNGRVLHFVGKNLKTLQNKGQFGLDDKHNASKSLTL